eukprot:1047436-Pleurochrysis_carterae.AAC.2
MRTKRARPISGRELALLSNDRYLNFGATEQAISSSPSTARAASKIERFLHFKFKRGGVAVLETEAARRAEARVLAAHDVAHWCSAAVDPKRRTQSTPRFKALFSSNAGGYEFMDSLQDGGAGDGCSSCLQPQASASVEPSRTL